MHTRYAYIPATTFVALTRAAIGADASAIFTPPPGRPRTLILKAF